MADPRQDRRPLLLILAAVDSLLVEARDSGNAERAARLEDLRARLADAPPDGPRRSGDPASRTF
jgi:hypothetical protein